MPSPANTRPWARASLKVTRLKSSGGVGEKDLLKALIPKTGIATQVTYRNQGSNGSVAEVVAIRALGGEPARCAKVKRMESPVTEGCQ